MRGHPPMGGSNKRRVEAVFPSATHYVAGRSRKGGDRRATSWRRVMRVKIFDLSWNVDLNRLENEINAFLAMLPSNAVKYVQSAAHLRELATLIRCKLITSLRFGTKENRKNPRPKNQRGGEIQIRAIIPDRNKIARFLASYARARQECASTNTLSILTVMSFFITPARLEPRASCPNGSARATGPAVRRIGLSSKTRRPLL